MHTHRPPAALLTRAVRVLVVGCGGTGSAVASGLPLLHQAMVARGHPYGLDVTLQDGDTVSLTNCVRQAFTIGEVGQHKAHILASRMNLFWGLRWGAATSYLSAEDPSAATTDVVIGCVDSREARRVINGYCTRPDSQVMYWLDLGNLADVGQFALGQPLNPGNPDTPGRLRTAPELWPEIVDTSRPIPNLPSCSAAEAITRQRPFLNPLLALWGLSLLDYLFAGGITHHGGFVSLQVADSSNRLVSAVRVFDQVPVPPPAELKRGRGARARRAGGGAA